MNHKLENNEAITATNKSDMVLAAFEEGIVVAASPGPTGPLEL